MPITCPMKSPIRITYQNQTFEFEPPLTLQEALERLGITPEAVLAIRGGELIESEVQLNKGDEVRLISVIAGG